jgi:hypothetical protein
MRKYLSMSDVADLPLTDIATEVAARFEKCVESGELDGISDEQLGLILGASIRLFAAKALDGRVPPIGHSNHKISATDAVVVCTAALETVGVEVFELSAWQALTDVGSRRRTPMNRDKDRLK